MCSPTSDGAAYCILANEAFMRADRLENQAIELVATGLVTDYLDSFAGRSAMDTVGYGMTRRLADKIFTQAAASRNDIGVVEFAANELVVTYPALGLCAVDDAHRFVERGDNTYGGKYVVNPSGGLEAKGHPLGATGLAMHFSITMQLRNWAGPMQAPGVFDLPDARGKYGLVHNIGLGGAVVLRRPEFYHADGPDGRDRDIITLMNCDRLPVQLWTRSDPSRTRKGNLQSCEGGPINFLERASMLLLRALDVLHHAVWCMSYCTAARDVSALFPRMLLFA
ncbi:hypothetical protein EDB89DRAFT_840738 [Lactarius sanguifluus]|nr:hypothetical protein EDB89DRAFT_840738 [Lactarius sanguifluus]